MLSSGFMVDSPSGHAEDLVLQVTDQREFSLIADPVQTELVLLEGIVNQP